MNAGTDAACRPLRHTRFQNDQRERIAPVERQRLDRLLLDDVAHHGVGGVEALVTALDVYDLRGLADFERRVNHQRGTYFQHRAGLVDSLEAAYFDRDRI